MIKNFYLRVSLVLILVKPNQLYFMCILCVFILFLSLFLCLCFHCFCVWLLWTPCSLFLIECSLYFLSRHCAVVTVLTQLCLTLLRPCGQTLTHQAPLSMGFSRQKYWSGLPFPPPGNLPNPGIELTSPAPPALASGFFTTVPPGKPVSSCTLKIFESLPFFFFKSCKYNF